MIRPAPSLELLRTATGRKLLRYGVASVVNVVVAQVVLAWAFGVLHWTARAAAVLAAVVAAGPAYYLARSWVWGRSGRSHLVKEVLPFWGMALLGLALTTWVAGVAETASADVTDSRLGQTLILMAAVFAISGVIWAVRFFVLNGVLFAERSPRSPVDVEVPAVPEW
jgi:putative flippase GtrA